MNPGNSKPDRVEEHRQMKQIDFEYMQKSEEYKRSLVESEVNKGKITTKINKLNDMIRRPHLQGEESMLVPGLIKLSDMCIIFSLPGTGKSALITQMAFGIDRGVQPYSLSASANIKRAPQPVIIYDAEQEEEDYQDRYGNGEDDYPDITIVNDCEFDNTDDFIEDLNEKFKDVAYTQLIATYALGTAWLYMGIVKSLSKIDDTELKKLIGDNGKLAFVMQVVQRLSANESTSKDIKSATKTLVQLTIMMSVANMISKVSKNGIVGISDALVFLDKLDFLGQKIFTMQDSAINDESVPKIMKNCEDVILSLGKISIVSTIAGMFVDKGKEGVSNMKTMVTQLKYLVNNINNKKNPLTVSKDEEPIKEIKDDTTRLITSNDSGTTGQDGEAEEPVETNDSIPGTSEETFEEPKKESKFINLHN